MSYKFLSKKDILAHARLLLGKSIIDLYGDVLHNYKGKGGLGQCVEKIHFKYSPNSASTPDFPSVGVELKCTPIKQNKDGSLVSKERLVLNIIDYTKEANTTFETSSFWKKNNCLLIMFYLYEENKTLLEFIFKIVRYWQFPEEDLKIIRDDWLTIHKKIVSGQAHTLSEGDTFYLGACVKGTKGGKNKRKQYASSVLADQRAYALKSKYLNTIIFDALSHSEMLDKNVYLSEKRRKKIQEEINKASSIVKNINDYKEKETFEEFIERKFSPYYGCNIYNIEQSLGIIIKDNPKSISNQVIHSILGVKTNKIKEFEKADIQQKSIRLEANGTLREAMSFSQIKYDELMQEEKWEDSVWYETLCKRFLFIVFRKSVDNDNKKAILEKTFFWTMPYYDLDKARKFWQHTRDKVRLGIFNQFMTAQSGSICHIRPKARNSCDLVPTKFGLQKKKAYWLNRKYVWSIVANRY